MTKLVFIGAGSTIFAKNLMGDILSFPELAASTINLHDIDFERLHIFGTQKPSSSSGDEYPPETFAGRPQAQHKTGRCRGIKEREQEERWLELEHRTLGVSFQSSSQS